MRPSVWDSSQANGGGEKKSQLVPTLHKSEKFHFYLHKKVWSSTRLGEKFAKMSLYVGYLEENLIYYNLQSVYLTAPAL